MNTSRVYEIVIRVRTAAPPPKAWRSKLLSGVWDAFELLQGDGDKATITRWQRLADHIWKRLRMPRSET